MPDQPRYYMNKSYEEDFGMNCQWDCTMAAWWHRLVAWEEWKVWACPLSFLWKTIYIEWYWEFKCVDTWWAIVKRGNIVRVDIWAWLGYQGLLNIETNKVRNPWDRKGYVVE